MICSLKLRRQLALTAAPAVFALTAASTMILAAASALTLRAASALPEGFDLDEVLEGMSESFRGSFRLRRDDGMMASGVGGGLKGCQHCERFEQLQIYRFDFSIDFPIER